MFITPNLLNSLLAFLEIMLLVLLLLALAVLVARNAQRLARWLLGVTRVMPGRVAGAGREQTLLRLYASFITFFAILLALVGILRIFVEPSQIIWIIGLFSAGFGLGARVLVADLLAGATYIFRNTFTIGEKVELIVGMNKVEGVVEDVDLRATLVRAPTGELYTVPNGEIGVIRNFTRSVYSGAVIKLNVPTAQLTQAIAALQALGERTPPLFPELIEPWLVLITGEAVGATTEVTVNARFAFGKAAPLKAKLVAAIAAELTHAGVRSVQDDSASPAS